MVKNDKKNEDRQKAQDDQFAREGGDEGRVVAPGNDDDLEGSGEAPQEDRANQGRTFKAEVAEGGDSGPFYADRVSDRNPLADKESDSGFVDEERGTRDQYTRDRGEQLAEEAVRERGNEAGTPQFVKNDGVVSVVSPGATDDKSDNGRVYNDARISPRDTNAPDAGLTPDGRRIAE